MRWHNEKRKIFDLIPLKNNPRRLTEKQGKDLKKSLEKFDLVEIPAINTDNTIIAGHQRLKIMALLGRGTEEIDVRVPDKQLTTGEVKEYCVRSNKNTGEFDFDILANEFEIDELLEIGFDAKDLKIDLKDAEKEIDILSSNKEELEGIGSVFDLKKIVKFLGAGIFDLPIIKSNMILDMPVPSVWAGADATKTLPPYLYNFSTDSTIGLPFNKTVISFYTEDSRFEQIWTDTANIVKRFLNKKILGIVSPNFSTYFNWPKALRIYNVYRSRWVTRYLQEAGIKVIPDITGSPNDLDFIFDGLPQGTPVCLQAHMAYCKRGIEDKKIVIDAIFEKLNPSCVWCYAPENRREMFPKLNDERVKFLEPRTFIRNAYRKKIAEKEETQNG